METGVRKSCGGKEKWRIVFLQNGLEHEEHYSSDLMSVQIAMKRFLAGLFALVIVSDLDFLWAQVGDTEHYFAQAAIGPNVKTTVHSHNPNTEEITVV